MDLLLRSVTEGRLDLPQGPEKGMGAAALGPGASGSGGRMPCVLYAVRAIASPYGLPWLQAMRWLKEARACLGRNHVLCVLAVRASPHGLRLMEAISGSWRP